jgi:hypothetical protein
LEVDGAFSDAYRLRPSNLGEEEPALDGATRSLEVTFVFLGVLSLCRPSVETTVRPLDPEAHEATDRGKPAANPASRSCERCAP